MLRDNALVELRKKFEKAKKERDELKLTLENFQTSSKNLSKLLATQMTDKTGLGYDNQVFNSMMFDCDELNSSESDVSVPTSPVHNRYKSGKGYHAVPPPYTGTFMPPKPDLVFHDALIISETVLNVLNVKPSTTKPNKELSLSNRPSAPIIEDWVSDSEDESEEINGGYIAFGGNPKGGKITGKGKIRTSKLDFDDVYFVKELKFNLFSVSQMCDKKNSDLFTKTKCVVLSSDFKLLDENHVLLRVLRENNMNNVDLKNIVSSGDLTCLFAKATLAESDNGTKFQNHDINQFCEIKGIKREFSIARTPQHNGAAERKNRTLIEAARTMLSDSLLLISFWAEAVNTTCYVQNRVLVTKPHNKTPYELLLGRTNSIGFMRPFGCLVTILNTLDPLGKFDGKADDGFLVGYSVSSKAFRVFNSRTRIVQETFHINFMKNKPNVAGNGPTWLSDIDTLTSSINYQPVVTGNQPNHNAGIQGNFHASRVMKDTESAQQYVLLPLWSTGSKDPQNTNVDDAFNIKEHESAVHVSPRVQNLSEEFEDFSSNSTSGVNVASTPVTAIGPNSTDSTNSFNAAGPYDNAVSSTFEISGKSLFVDPSQYPDDLNMPALEDIIYSNDEEDVGAEADYFKLETSIAVIPILTTRVHKYHPITQINGDLSLALQTRSMTRMVKDQEPKRVHQVLKDPSWIKTMLKELLQFKMQKGHTQKEGIDYEEVFAPVVRIEAIMLFLAYASFMGFLINQMDVKNAFLYGTIEEEVYVCQPPGFEDPDYLDKVYKVVKALYGLHQAPRDWYLKGKSHLGLWYPKDSPFNLVAYSDSDYAGASLDKKFTTGRCQFLGCILISWQCKKKTVVATSLTEDKYVAAASCCAQYQVDEKDGIEVTIVDLKLLMSVADLSSHNTKYTSSALTQKVFANIRRIGKGFSGVDTPLFDADTVMDDQEDASKQGEIAELDANEDVTLEDIDAEVAIDADDTDEVEPAEVEEVIKVVTAAKLMTEVVTTAATTITTAQVPKASAPKKKRGVVIQDPEETATALVIVHSKNDVVDQVKRKEKQYNTVMRYQALKRNPLTEAQARKNIMVYLKNMAGFKMDFFKCMAYTDIRPIFEKYYNSIQAFLEKGENEIEEEGSKRKDDNLKKRVGKKQRINEEEEELKAHLQIVVNDDDDVSTEATPLASKVPIVGY
nr:hypothetical protein [Tanacetum cinerariifolium]